MNTMKLKKNDTVEAEIFLNCGETGAEHKCAKLRTALLDVPEVTSAETVETRESDVNFCVVGTAIVEKNKTKEFKESMANFAKEIESKGLKIRDSKILLEKA